MNSRLVIAARPRPRPHILVVDDDLYSRELSAGVLIRSGYTVDTAGDGREAWWALHRERYDLLITEPQPARDPGPDLLQQMREEAMRLPVILASRRPPAEGMHPHPGGQIQAVVTHPCSLNVLLQTVQTVLSGSQPR